MHPVRYVLGGGLAVLVCALAACQPKGQEINFGYTIEEEPGRPVSRISMGDPVQGQQIVSGLYGVEGNAWRWTGKQFTVRLRRTPVMAAQGARLTATLSVIEGNLKQLGSQTLACRIGSAELPSQTYAKPGEQTYSADVPATALATELVEVTCTLDKATAPSATEERPLGVVLSSIGLESRQ